MVVSCILLFVCDNDHNMEHFFTGVLFHYKCLRTPFYIYALAKTRKNLVIAVYVQFVPTAIIRIFLVFAVNVLFVLTAKTKKNLIIAVGTNCSNSNN